MKPHFWRNVLFWLALRSQFETRGAGPPCSGRTVDRFDAQVMLQVYHLAKAVQRLRGDLRHVRFDLRMFKR